MEHSKGAELMNVHESSLQTDSDLRSKDIDRSISLLNSNIKKNDKNDISSPLLK